MVAGLYYRACGNHFQAEFLRVLRLQAKVIPMAEFKQSVDAACPTCGWQQSCNDAQMVEMLRGIQKLGARKAPGGLVLIEVFRHSLAEIPCPDCGKRGLRVGLADPDDDGDWQEAKACDGCGRPIEMGRLEAMPDATLCVACQRAAEEGDTTVEQEYCERCGSPMQLVPSRGPGLSRYVLRCSGGCR